MKNWTITLWKVVRIIFAAFMVFAGAQHFLNPEMYVAFVPAFLPFTMTIIYLSGILEIALGILMLIPKYIKIDGNLASVWTPSEFYYNGNFSHCGANSFQLFNNNGKWQIIYIVDMRRRDNCKALKDKK